MGCCSSCSKDKVKKPKSTIIEEKPIEENVEQDKSIDKDGVVVVMKEKKEEEKKEEPLPPRLQKAQHAKIVIKCQKASDLIDTTIEEIYHDVGKNKSSESKRLDGLVDKLKDSFQQIEDSMEDLKFYRFTYDDEFYEKFKRDEKLISHVYTQYSKYEKDLVAYKIFRKKLLGIVKDAKPKLPEYDEEEEQREIVEEQKPVIPEKSVYKAREVEIEHEVEEPEEKEVRANVQDQFQEEERRIEDIEPKVEDTVVEEEEQKPDESYKQPEVTEEEEPREITEYERKMDKIIALKIEKEKNDAEFELENMKIAYKRLEEDFDEMRANRLQLRKENDEMNEEIEDLKKANHNIGYENDALLVENKTFAYVKDGLVRENERIKENFDNMKMELMDLQNKAEKQEEDHDEIEDGIKMKQLESQVKENQEAMLELQKEYEDLFNKYKAKSKEVQEERKALHERAFEEDLKRISAGEFHLTHDTALDIKTPAKDLEIPGQNLTTRVVATHNLIDDARKSRIDREPLQQLNNSHLDNSHSNLGITERRAGAENDYRYSNFAPAVSQRGSAYPGAGGYYTGGEYDVPYTSNSKFGLSDKINVLPDTRPFGGSGQQYFQGYSAGAEYSNY